MSIPFGAISFKDKTIHKAVNKRGKEKRVKKSSSFTRVPVTWKERERENGLEFPVES